MAQSMGIGQLGNPSLVFKRKFRWTFKIEVGKKTVPEYFVKVAGRPNISTEETEINFLNAKSWIPGKSSWETMTITYIDVASQENQSLWDWLATIYDFTDNVGLKQASQKKDYAGTGTLKLFDGTGSELEKWELGNMWPSAINFGDLDMSSSDTVDIELTLRYSEVKYTPNTGCGMKIPQGQYSTCSS